VIWSLIGVATIGAVFSSGVIVFSRSSVSV
jgi:hypothetical protein